MKYCDWYDYESQTCNQWKDKPCPYSYELDNDREFKCEKMIETNNDPCEGCPFANDTDCPGGMWCTRDEF